MHQPRFPKKKIYTVLLQALSLGLMASATLPTVYAQTFVLPFPTGDYSADQPTDISTTSDKQIQLATESRGVRIYTSKKYTLETPANSSDPTVVMLAGSTLNLNTSDIAGKDNTTVLNIIGKGTKSAAIWIGRERSGNSEIPIYTDQDTIFKGQYLNITQKDAVGIDGKGSPNNTGGSELTTLELSNSSITAEQGIVWVDNDTNSRIVLNDVKIASTKKSGISSSGLSIESASEASTELLTDKLSITNKDNGRSGLAISLAGGGVNATLHDSTLSSTSGGVAVTSSAVAHFTGTTSIKASSSSSLGQSGISSDKQAKVTVDHLIMDYQSATNNQYDGALASYEGELIVGKTGQEDRSKVVVFNPNSGRDTRGVHASFGGDITLNSVDLVNFRKKVIGEDVSDNVLGLLSDYGSHITLNDSTVILKPSDKDFPFIPVGAEISSASFLTLNQGSSIEAGQYAVRMSEKSTLEMNDSNLTAGKAAIYAQPTPGKNQQDTQLVATLSNSKLSALQKKSNDPLGAVVLMGTSYQPDTPAYMNMQVSNNSVLEGDYLYNVQLGMLDLKVEHSSLSGAAHIAAPFSSSAPRSIVNVELNNGSVWTLQKDKDPNSSSTAEPDYLHANSLKLNQSLLSFAKPKDMQHFQQFAIETLDGQNGVIELWAELQDDNSTTDQLIIRDHATGTTHLRIKRFDDELDDGAQTNVGIKVVSADSGTTVNTATTADNAFVLDSGSTGYRSSATPSLVAGLYDYYLVKGGKGGEAESWYLNSTLAPVEPDPVDPDPVDPDPVDPDPVDPDPVDPDPVDPDPVDPTTYRPEIDAYFANRQMAISMQRHRWQERISSQAPGSKAWGRLVYQEDKFNNQFGYKRKMESTTLHFGADVWQTTFSDLSKLSIGAMALFSDGKSKTRNEQFKAQGKVTGYNLGVYATWQQNPDSDAGVYVDSWLMQGWFRNKVQGDGLAEEKYNSRSFSASLEGGYGFVLSESESIRYSLQPQAQVIWSRFSANDVYEQTQTRVHDQGKSFTSYRLGLRFKADIAQDNGMQLAPFAELNYWRHPSSSRISFNERSAKDITPKNVFATTVGMQAQLSKSTTLSGRFSYMMGNERYRDSNVQLSVNYAW